MENKITSCVFDNPNSMCRELWQNKLMVRSAPAEMVADFKPGKVEGDPDAVMGAMVGAAVVVGIDPIQPTVASVDSTQPEIVIISKADNELITKIKTTIDEGKYIFLTPSCEVFVGDFDNIVRCVQARAGLEVLFNTIMGAAEAGDFLVLAPNKTIHIGGTLDMAYESAKTAAATTTEAPSIITKVH